MCMQGLCCRGQKRSLGPLEQELEVVDEVATELRPSERAGAISSFFI